MSRTPGDASTTSFADKVAPSKVIEYALKSLARPVVSSARGTCSRSNRLCACALPGVEPLPSRSPEAHAGCAGPADGGHRGRLEPLGTQGFRAPRERSDAAPQSACAGCSGLIASLRSRPRTPLCSTCWATASGMRHRGRSRTLLARRGLAGPLREGGGPPTRRSTDGLAGAQAFFGQPRPADRAHGGDFEMSHVPAGPPAQHP